MVVNSSVKNLLLAIETSCDESAAAIIDEQHRILSSVTFTQEALHNTFRGIVPEVASRAHCALLLPIIESALEKAGSDWKNLKAVAVTVGPGLLGSLLVGLSSAKALAAALKIPLIAIDHLEAHAFSGFIDHTQPPQFPFMALLVSGGHTLLLLFREIGYAEVLGSTQDDAVGEAYDKVASLMGLPYPGGPHIDRLAQQYFSTHNEAPPIELPVPLLHAQTLDFSFSGLKTAVNQRLAKHPLQNETDKMQLAAAFQRAAITALMAKLRLALQRYPVQQLVVAGGVACNEGLRQALKNDPMLSKLELLIAQPKYCTDNAGMCAHLAAYYSAKEKVARLDIAPYASVTKSTVFHFKASGQ